MDSDEISDSSCQLSSAATLIDKNRDHSHAVRIKRENCYINCATAKDFLIIGEA
jgi:hypothetical protein